MPLRSPAILLRPQPNHPSQGPAVQLRALARRWPVPLWRLGAVWVTLLLALQSQPVASQTPPPAGPSRAPQYESLGADLKLVPQTLLGLIHAPEVQREVGLEQPPGDEFLRRLREIDGPWWRARNLPEAERRIVIAKQEELLLELLQKLLEPSQLERLRQLELQAQGARMLLRPEVAAFLQLTPAQRADAEGLFTETERLRSAANPSEPQSDPAKQEAALKAKRGEAAAALKLLDANQQQLLARLLGPRFDTTKLSRIYPLAPELVDTKVWVGDRQVRREELKGKVVLVHFYAFQCHNCQANFAHYNRWQEDLTSRGVVVVGIQTPELEEERDPAQVSAAARAQGFEFPVLIDLQNANWDAWGNTMWPTVYVIDRDGYIRMWWQGELNWQGAKGEQAIEELVKTLLEE